MGTSTVELKEKGFWIRDGLLELWLLALVREIDNIEPCPHWLREARDHWYLQSTIGLTGCISPNLDDFITSQDRNEEIISISQTALASLNDLSIYSKNDLYVKPPDGTHNSRYDEWLNDILLDLHEYALHNLREFGKLFLTLLRAEWPFHISDKEAAAWMSERFKLITYH